MKLSVDTSVTVAAFLSTHTHHDAAAAVVRRRPVITAQVAFETVSVLTRLPGAGTVPAVHRYVKEAFAPKLATLTDVQHRRLLRDIERAGIAGGSVYDALVARSAMQHGLRLISRDRRASRVYDLVGVEYELLEGAAPST